MAGEGLSYPTRLDNPFLGCKGCILKIQFLKRDWVP